MKFSRDNARTGGVGDRETTDLDRRSQDAVKLHGIVREVDYKKKPPMYRAGFGDPKDEDNYILTDWLPAAGGRAQGDVDTHFLEVGERVAMLSEGGETATAQLIPAGTYTDDDDSRRAGADKPGLWRKQFKGGAEISYDRETGDLLFNAKGKKQSSDGNGQDQDIPGTATINAAGGSLVMKDNAITGTVGDATFTHTKDAHTIKIGGVTLKISGDGVDVTGGYFKHNGRSIGSDHVHTNVMNGGGQSGPPA